jgi:hypothetical protein
VVFAGNVGGDVGLQFPRDHRRDRRARFLDADRQVDVLAVFLEEIRERRPDVGQPDRVAADRTPVDVDVRRAGRLGRVRPVRSAAALDEPARRLATDVQLVGDFALREPLLCQLRRPVDEVVDVLHCRWL